MSVTGQFTRTGRVYLEPEPPNGPHPGFRGLLTVDSLGVHIDYDCESLSIGDPDKHGFVTHEWEPVIVEELIPWHRVHSIEWTPPDDPEVAS